MPAVSARRYAQAAFAVAEERDAFNVWERDLTRARELYADQDLLAFMSAPSVPAAVKLDGISTLLPDIDPLVRNLVSLVTENGDAERFEGVCAIFGELLDEHRRIGRARVVTAVPLDDGRREILRERLTELGGYERVEITEEVDASILGGIIARVGDRLIDGSSRSKLRTMREALSERPVTI